MNLREGTLLQGGKYRIERELGHGGFGITYEAEHVMLGERVAIKEFFVKDFCNRDERTARVTVGTQSKKGLVDKLKKKFIDEARVLYHMQHPGIVHVSDVFEENGTAYFVMDYIDGPSLNGIVAQEGALPEARAVRYIRQVAEALKYVHDKNRLHLDIKPGNIMVNSQDNAILIDFGASKQYDEVNGENTSTLVGKTPGYAPLEQMGNDVVKFMPATDIYALGATLYKLLTGITPISANLLAGGEELEPLPKHISASTRKAITAAMNNYKTKRPQTVDAFLELLGAGMRDDTKSVDTEEVTTFADKGVLAEARVSPIPSSRIEEKKRDLGAPEKKAPLQAVEPVRSKVHESQPVSSPFAGTREQSTWRLVLNDALKLLSSLGWLLMIIFFPFDAYENHSFPHYIFLLLSIPLMIALFVVFYKAYADSWRIKLFAVVIYGIPLLMLLGLTTTPYKVLLPEQGGYEWRNVWGKTVTDGYREFTKEPYVKIEKNHKEGMEDLYGIVVVPCVYSTVEWNESGNYFEIRKDGKSGIWKDGKEAIACKYDRLSELRYNNGETKCFVVSENDKYGIVDGMGKVIVELEYDKIEESSLQGCVILTKKADWMSMKGVYNLGYKKEIIPCRYTTIACAEYQDQKVFKCSNDVSLITGKYIDYVDVMGNILESERKK